MAIQTPTTQVADDLIATLDSLTDEFRAESDKNEGLGYLSERTVELLETSGARIAMFPTEYGGLDLSPYDALRVYEKLGLIDTALGWVGSQAGTVSQLLRLYPTEVLKELGAEGRLPYVAGQVAPTGKAIRVDGGYKISGAWSYGSGIRHAEYADGAALITEDGKPVLDPETGAPQMIVFITPVENAQLGENWEVFGLQATGSIDYTLEDVFVPDNLVLTDFMAPVEDGAERAQLPTQTGWLLMFHAAAALGTGRRLLDELAEYARKPSSRGIRLADDIRFAREYSMAEGRFRAFRAYMYETFERIQASVNDGRVPDLQMMTDLRVATIQLHEVNVENGTFAFREAGGAAIRPSALRRVYNDIMVMGQHILVSPAAYVDCSKVFLGEAEGKRWVFYQLVD